MSENTFDILIKLYQDMRRVQKKIESISHLLEDMDKDSKLIFSKIKSIAEEIAIVGDNNDSGEENK